MENGRPTLETDLELTPEQHREGGEFPLVVRHGRAKVELMVRVPPSQPEESALRLRDIPVGAHRFDIIVRPVARRLLPVWPVTLLGAGLFLAGWLGGRAPALLFGGLLLLGMGLYGKLIGRLPIAGRRTTIRDLLFLLWLIVVATAGATWLSKLPG